MTSSDAYQALEKCKLSADEAHTLPPEFYSSPDLMKAEGMKIFRTGWVGVGRADRWPAPGDYSAMDIAGVPVVVVRGKDGRLNAFANSCRHRGARLLSGDGNCPGIRCPFHSWAYTLDGRLAGVPNMELAKNFDREDYGLMRFRTAERAGFAFLCLADEAPDIDHWLGDFEALHGPWKLDELVSTRRREFEVECNWKPFLEVFNEYYHLPYVHPDTVNDIYNPPDEADATTGAYVSQFGSTEGTGGLLQDSREKPLPVMKSLEGRNRQGVRYSWVFPNMTFAAGADAVWVYETYPVGPGRCRVGMTACFAPETTAMADFEYRVQHYYKRLDEAIAEDIPALEDQQIGLASDYAQQGRFSPLLEANVAGFARWYAGQMAP